MSISEKREIAEDEPLILQGFKVMVSSLGHTIIGTAMNGQDAIDGVPELRPDLAIMDINMPDVDGLQAIEAINQQVKLPFIVVTGYQDPELLEKAAQLGVFGYLPKPVDVCEIRNTIEIAMTRIEEVSKLEKDLADSQNALKERKLLDRAKGILMEKMGISEPQAMKHLQKLARDRNTRLVVIAQEIINASTLFKL